LDHSERTEGNFIIRTRFENQDLQVFVYLDWELNETPLDKQSQPLQSV
jgi:hypothetical protein